jgi:hypothetical protein
MVAFGQRRLLTVVNSALPVVAGDATMSPSKTTYPRWTTPSALTVFPSAVIITTSARDPILGWLNAAFISAFSTSGSQAVSAGFAGLPLERLLFALLAVVAQPVTNIDAAKKSPLRARDDILVYLMFSWKVFDRLR